MPRYVVSVSDEHSNAAADVADRLRAGGIEVEQIHSQLGMIVVLAAPADVASITTVDGVAEVSESVEHQLPPPDSPVQ